VAHAEGRIGDDQLRAAEDRAILTVLELQRQIGVDVYSDGEYRRGMWITGLPAAVEGFGPGAMLNIGKYVPVARLALGPQCGFASVAAGNEISWDDQRRKLELLVETARKVWGG